MNHDRPYPDGYIASILATVRTIAVVGASADPLKDSHRVTLALANAGYDVIPVNPRPGLTEIRDLKVFPSLAAIDRPVDMVDVFRPSAELLGIAEQAVAIRAAVLWAQIGIQDPQAARLAEAAGLKVVMDRCTKVELRRMRSRSDGEMS
ncbi:MAG: CoA-binding protein [Rhodobacteraceae bacterium]|nr:CoA-binding protein [Paracoccaceae bacterium]